MLYKCSDFENRNPLKNNDLILRTSDSARPQEKPLSRAIPGLSGNKKPQPKLVGVR
jgi:hypothetical protein